MKKALALFLALLSLVPCVTACGASNDGYQRYAMSFFGTFDTIVQIIGYAKDEETFARVTAGAQALFERLNQVYDIYNPYEGVHNLYEVNREAGSGPAKAEPELMALLTYCKQMQPMTRGTVNVGLGSVLALWHGFRDDAEFDPENAAKYLPAQAALEAAAKHTNMDDVALDAEANTVAFLDPALRLDVGAVAKGFACEVVAQWMMKSGMPSFIISAGGNVRAGDPPRDGRRAWVVQVQDPDGSLFATDGSDILDKVIVSGMSVVTSGDYQRFITVGDRRYHHLISPDTLQPGNFMRAVTIVTKDSGYADLLSTAVFLMPYEQGRAYVDSLEGVDALWVLNDRTIMMTDGMKAITASNGATSQP